MIFLRRKSTNKLIRRIGKRRACSFSGFQKQDYIKHLQQIEEEINEFKEEERQKLVRGERHQDDTEAQINFIQYKIFDIPKMSELDLVKKRFRDINKNLHPDLSQDLSKDQYMMITNAYKILGKLKSKEKYDEQELEMSGNLEFGGNVYNMNRFLMLAIGVSMAFWIWYKRDTIEEKVKLRGKTSGCPVEHHKRKKMRNDQKS